MNLKRYKELFSQKKFVNIIQELSCDNNLNNGLLYQIYIDSCLRIGNTQLAVEKWEKLNKEFPKFPNNQLLRAQIYKKQELWNSALKKFTLAIQNYPYTQKSLTKIKVEMLDCFFKLNKEKQIVNVVSEILISGQDSKTLIKVFKKLIESNRIALVEEFLPILTTGSMEFHQVHAIYFQNVSNLQNCIYHWEKVCELDPKDYKFKLNLLRAYERGGFIEKLCKQSDIILSTVNVGPQIVKNVFFLLQKNGKSDIIESNFERHKNEIDENSKSFFEAYLLHHNQKYFEAIDLFNDLIKDKNKLPPQILKASYKLLIDSCFKVNNGNELVAACLECAKKYPKYIYAYHKLISWYQNNHNFKNPLGINILEEAIHNKHLISPNMILRYCNLLDLLGQEQKSYNILSDNVGQSEQFVLPLLKKYLASEHLGGIAGFLRMYESSLNSPQIKLSTFNILFETYLLNGHYEIAFEVLKRIDDLPIDKKELNTEFHLFAIEALRLKNILNCELLDLVRILDKNEKDKLYEEFENLKLEATSNKHFKSILERFLNRPLQRNLFSSYENIKSKKLINTYNSPNEIFEVVKYIKEKIKSRTPCSIIRLGDGEGVFLPYPKEIQSFQKEDQERILNIWWANAEEVQAHFANDIKDALNQSIEDADIIGLTPKRRSLKVLKHCEGKEYAQINGSIRGLLSLANFMQTKSYKADIISSSYVQADLDSWGAYQILFEDFEEVSIISCHDDIVAYLKRRFGFKKVELFRIPGEHKYLKQFNYETEKAHYPKVFNKLSVKLKKMAKGKVFLVAAGFLGKIYCNIIKKNGGIAIDVGSIVDKWLGYNTRNYHGASSTLNGIPFHHTSQISLPKISSNQIVRTNFHHNKLLTPLEISKSKPTVQFLLTGHPRSGTGFASNLFNKMGLDIGHEKLNTHGISSWLHAVKNQNTPFFSENKLGSYNISRYAFKHEYLLLLIRNPVDIIPSIVIENRNNVSYSFRRFHIFQELSIDLNEYTFWLDKAILSYLSWVKIIKKQNPHAIFKVESLKAELTHFFEQEEINYRKLELNYPAKTNLNNTKQKFGIEKPTISLQQYMKVDKLILRELITFCEEHNYPSDFIAK